MKITLVIGASLKPIRYSYIAINKLIAAGEKVVAIGLRKGIVAGVSIDTEMKPYQDIETVTLYLNSTRQVSYYDYIISLKPKRVIFNPGTENMEFIELLQKNGIIAEVACTLVLLSTNQYQTKEG